MLRSSLLNGIWAQQETTQAVKSPSLGTMPADAKRKAGGRHVDRVAVLYKVGVIRPSEITLYKLFEPVEATRSSETRHVRGKLVFNVQ